MYFGALHKMADVISLVNLIAPRNWNDAQNVPISQEVKQLVCRSFISNITTNGTQERQLSQWDAPACLRLIAPFRVK